MLIVGVVLFGCGPEALSDRDAISGCYVHTFSDGFEEICIDASGTYEQRFQSESTSSVKENSGNLRTFEYQEGDQTGVAVVLYGFVRISEDGGFSDRTEIDLRPRREWNGTIYFTIGNRFEPPRSYVKSTD